MSGDARFSKPVAVLILAAMVVLGVVVGLVLR